MNIITSRKTIQQKILLHSDDGSTTPTIDIINIEYNSALADPSLPNLINVEGFAYTAGLLKSGEDIKVRPYEAGYWNGDIFHEYVYETIATSDSEGHFSGYVFMQGSGKFWDFKIGKQSYKVALLDQEEMELKDATTWELIED